ncbi:MAG: COG1361 S-layer family protein [archaeon]
MVIKIKKKLLLIIPIIFFLAATTALSSYRRGRVIDGTERELWIEEYSTLPTDPEVGFKSIILQVDFKHTGTATYRNMTFRAEEPPQLEAIREEFHITRMNPDDVFTTSYKFNVKEDTTPGVYTVPIHVEYTDIGSDEDNKTAKITREARVEVSDETRIEIIDIDQEEPVKPGEEFKTELTVKNIGNMPSNLLKASLDLREISQQTTMEGQQIENPEEAINWKRQYKTIDYLQPGETRKVEFTGKTSISADNKIYPAIATVEGGGEPETNKFTVTVEGDPKLMEAGLSTTGDDPRAGEKTAISIQLENIGRGEAKATKLEVKEGEYEGVKTAHIGTIDDDGGMGTAIMDLTFKEPGKHELIYEVTYQNALGEEYTETFTGEVYIEPEKKSYINYIIGTVIILAAVYLIHRKIKKSKEDEEIDI